MVLSIFLSYQGSPGYREIKVLKHFFSQGTTESGKTWTHRQARTLKYDAVSTAGVQSCACLLSQEKQIAGLHTE